MITYEDKIVKREDTLFIKRLRAANPLKNGDSVL